MSRYTFGALWGLLLMVLIGSSSAQAQSLEGVQQSIRDGITTMANGVNKLAEKPNRDFLTLVIGGGVGYFAGKFVSGISLLEIQALAISLMPLAGGIAGVYLANEGYFDGVRDAIRGKF